VEYRKSFANKLDIYPKSLEDVVDVMRQQPAKKCRVWKCPKKDKIAAKDWYKPEHAPKTEDTKAESSGFTTVEFSGAQRTIVKAEDPDEILDSGSTITLGRSKMK